MPDALHEAKAAEFKLRQEMRAIQRDIRAARAEASSAAFEAQKRSEGQQMRDAINQQWLRDELSGIPAADEASVLAFSEACNARLAELIMMQEKGTHLSWIKLFRRVDEDSSGLISYGEFTALIRSELGLPEAQVPKRAVKQVWIALDADRSGHIDAGEFGHFMRLGEIHRKTGADGGGSEAGGEGGWRTRLTMKNKEKAERQRQEKARLFHRDIAEEVMRGEPADEAEIVRLANLLMGRITELAEAMSTSNSLSDAPMHKTWFDLFKRVDTDGSGKIDYKEFRHMCRVELGLNHHELRERELKKVWIALDSDGSGHITTGEFAAFARKAQIVTNDRKEEQQKELRRQAHESRQNDLDEIRKARETQLRLVQERRRLAKGRAEESKQRIESEAIAVVRRNRETARQIRARAAQLDLVANLQGIAMAKAEEVQRLAECCAARIVELGLEDPEGKRPTWCGLFKRVDTDGSGKIDMSEFEKLVRSELRLSEAAFSTEGIKRVWRAIDEDGNHFITVGEFFKFGQLGQAVFEEADKDKVTRSMFLERRAKGAHQARKAEQAAMFNHAVSKAAAKSGVVASAEQVTRLSEIFNNRLTEMCQEEDATITGWYGLFKFVDTDKSGQIDFGELRRMVRRGLDIDREEVKDDELKALWVALDTDGSGLISAGEFGQFMNRAAPKMTTLAERRARLQKRSQEEAKQVKQELRRKALSMVEERKAEYAERVKALAAELEAFRKGHPVGGGGAEGPAEEGETADATHTTPPKEKKGGGGGGVTLPAIRENKRSASEPPARFPQREGDPSRRSKVSQSVQPYGGSKHRSRLPQLGAGRSPSLAGLPIAARAEGMRLRSEPRKHGAINHHLVVM